MNIVKSNFEIVEQEFNKGTLLEDMFKHIEKCGRVCYKSEDKITDDSYKKFVNMLEESKHGAMLEHGTIYLTIPLGRPIDDNEYTWKYNIIKFFQNNKYSKVKEQVIYKNVDVVINGFKTQRQVNVSFYHITTNWRVIFENTEEVFIKYFDDDKQSQITQLKESIMQWLCEPTEYHEKRYTVMFTYHLAVARDINRHRVHSIAEESTRYCNYSKDKFGQELNIIEPIWFTPLAKNKINSKEQWSLKTMCRLIAQGRENEMDSIDMWRFVNLACELGYMYNTKNYGWTPQQASLMLPLDTKTCSVHTAFASDWKEFFNLRALGTTGSPRPSAKEVAWPLMMEFINRKYLTLEDIDLKRYYEITEKYKDINDYIKI